MVEGNEEILWRPYESLLLIPSSPRTCSFLPPKKHYLPCLLHPPFPCESSAYLRATSSPEKRDPSALAGGHLCDEACPVTEALRNGFPSSTG